jgi:hypothetical protein
MNKTLLTTALVSNLLSLLLIQSELSGSGHGAGAFFMLVFIGIIWLIATVILIVIWLENKNNLSNSLINKIIIIFCTPIPMMACHYFFLFP